MTHRVVAYQQQQQQQQQEGETALRLAVRLRTLQEDT